MTRYAFLVFAILFAIANCEDDGKYRPETYGGDDGKYHPDDEGRYIADYDDGNYRGAESRIYYNPRFPAQQKKGVVRNLEAPRQDYNQFVNRFVVDQASASNISPFQRQPVGVIGSKGSVHTSQLNVPAKSYKVETQYENPEARSQILKQDVDVGPDSYHFLFETDNNIRVEEDGKLINQGTKKAAIAATGFYEYVGPDNVKYRVDYIADENGFQPLGDHLPTPPPIPAEIANILVNRN